MKYRYMGRTLLVALIIVLICFGPLLGRLVLPKTELTSVALDLYNPALYLFLAWFIFSPASVRLRRWMGLPERQKQYKALLDESRTKRVTPLLRAAFVLMGLTDAAYAVPNLIITADAGIARICLFPLVVIGIVLGLLITAAIIFAKGPNQADRRYAEEQIQKEALA